MKYSKATNYALHTMMFMVASPDSKPVGVQPLAERQGVSQAYLSKILTKLVKARLIESASGANGGYRLTRRKDEITFLDVIHAIEGNASLFDCGLDHGDECLIQQVMLQAESELERSLQNKKLVDLIPKER